jgi:hypothetical protein
MQTYFCYKVASKWGNIRWKTQVNLLKMKYDQKLL